MTKYKENMFAEYREIKGLRSGNVISLSKREYARLKSTLDILEIYVPLVDDHGVDCVTKREDGTFLEVQIKARSKEVTDGDAALFVAITYEFTENFYFVFFYERLNTMWIMSSQEFLNECVTNKNGKNARKHSIWFNGNRKNKDDEKLEYCKPQFEKYVCKDFSRFH